jgi:hypothetical protein
MRSLMIMVETPQIGGSAHDYQVSSGGRGQ